MTPQPRLEFLGAALGDLRRRYMLCALMDGRAHTSKELALLAGISAATGSSHLNVLRAAGLIVSEKSGRSIYHRIACDHVAEQLEGLATLVPPSFAQRLRQARRTDPDSLIARCCYNHIAGWLGVAIGDALVARGAIAAIGETCTAGPNANLLTKISGLVFNQGDLVGKHCLDWSERRPHIAGSLGQAMLDTSLDRGWLVRTPSGRALRVTGAGRQAYADLLGLNIPGGAKPAAGKPGPGP